ncbi:MAG: preprotein translocase subunit SecE [Verrucomicrobiota bacterium]
MQYLEYLKIGGDWVLSGVIYTLLITAIVVLCLKWVPISRFGGEVKGELRKANWPWESDPKIKGFKKFKELIDSTIVVIVAMLLLAGFVQLWDLLHVTIVGFFHGLGR